VPVRAEIVQADAFSAHADADDVLSWLAGAPEPAATYVVHGEASAAAALRDRLDHELGWTAAVPTLGERVTIRARVLGHRSAELPGKTAPPQVRWQVNRAWPKVIRFRDLSRARLGTMAAIIRQ